MMSLVLEWNKNEIKASYIVKNTVRITMKHVTGFVSRICDNAKSDPKRVGVDHCMIATVWAIVWCNIYGNLTISVCKTQLKSTTWMPSFWFYYYSIDLYPIWYADSYKWRRSMKRVH